GLPLRPVRGGDRRPLDSWLVVVAGAGVGEPEAGDEQRNVGLTEPVRAVRAEEERVERDERSLPPREGSNRPWLLPVVGVLTVSPNQTHHLCCGLRGLLDLSFQRPRPAVARLPRRDAGDPATVPTAGSVPEASHP